MTTTVAVIGGGYGGTAVAKQLDGVADVVLVEPREDFVHHVAALRGLVDPQWTDKLFYPYDRLLARGKVIRDHAVKVDPTGITLGSGERITADYVVLATGSAYPFPAKIDFQDSASAKAKIRATREELAGANRVLLLGAGPVGLELAGEIKAVWPEKTVTIVDPAKDILPGVRGPDRVHGGQLGRDRLPELPFGGRPRRRRLTAALLRAPVPLSRRHAEPSVGARAA